ncbi:MAG: hypothetical protein CSB55_01915 [Candidatus Cloacimonadota bacterium]|nr:MAG: hypothetical protein CSB55_01915 [Candidatus Cloacimonadota bacterium]
MKQIGVWLLVAILSITLYRFYEINRKLEKDNAVCREELAATTAYASKMQAVADSLKSKSERIGEIPKNDRIKDVLEKFFSERSGENSSETDKIGIEELREEIEDFRQKQSFYPDGFPLEKDYKITRKFSEKHPATDIAKNSGAEVKAVASGVVKAVYCDKYFGNVVLIDHFNGYASLYAHLSAVFVKVKFFAEKGETIGLVGNTGNSSAPHLHLEILFKGKNIDPLLISGQK